MRKVRMVVGRERVCKVRCVDEGRVKMRVM